MLIEAAQHLDKHPGPLGHFFRRLLKKKTRNVAVVAAARKLAVIGWMMLDRNEPYRYAIPKTANRKLSKLRVTATGQRHKGGLAKGSKCQAKLPGGSRTIKSLAAVCQTEGLPSPLPLSSGERRTVMEAGCDAFVDQIGRTQVVPRRTNAPKANAQTNHAAIAHQDAMATGSLATATSAARPRGRTSGRLRQASCQVQTSARCRLSGFRPHRAGEQGDEAPPPAPPTLSSVPGRRRAPAKKSTPAS